MEVYNGGVPRRVSNISLRKIFLRCIPVAVNLIVALVALAYASPANALAGGDTVSSSIVLPEEVDTYTFSASAGNGIVMRVAATGGDTNFLPRFLISAPDGSYLPYQSNGGEYYYTYEVELDGTYTVAVFDSGQSDTGTYNLSFAIAPGSTDGGVIAGGDTPAGTIENGGIDSYSFTANAGEGIVVRVAATGGDVNFLPRFLMFGPDGGYLPYQSYGGEYYYTGEVALSGAYTIVVFDSSQNDTGTYNLSFAIALGSTDGGVIAGGETRAGTIESGGIDSYSFTANAGVGIVVRVAPTGGDTNFLPRFLIFGPDGGYLPSQSYGGEYYYTGELALAGAYTVAVFDSSQNDNGTYNLSFAIAQGSTDGGVIAGGDTPAGTIESGGIDSYSFTANAGEEILLQVTSTGGDTNFLPRFLIFGPDGSYLPSQSYGGEYYYTGEVGLSGTHTIAVFDSSQNDTGSYSLSFDLNNQILSYAALGDSYSSGEGVWPYFDPTDTKFTGRHQSTRAYSTKLRVPGTSEPIASRADAEFDFFACTGATTQNVQAAGEACRDKPTQLAPENNIDASRELITISIGGNDAQFANVLEFCMAHNHCNTLQPFDPYSNVELGELAYLIAIRAGIRQLETFLEIKAAAPNASIIAFGYPVLLGGAECSAASIPGTDARHSLAEQEWMREINVFMNKVTAQAAALAGVHFVSVAEQFEGHGVCGPLDDWINGVVLHDPYASFHPKARGIQAYADAGNAYLEGIKTGWAPGYFPTGLPRNPAPTVLFPDIDFGEGVPAATPTFGELSVALAFAPSGCQDARNVVVPGQGATMTGVGFAADSSVTLQLVVEEKSWALGTALTDGGGKLSTTLTIPGAVPTGIPGLIEALGAGTAGAGLNLLADVAVRASVNVDGDGDGIPDGCDNCPGAANAVQADQDLDGVGDVCDQCPNEFINDEDGDGMCAAVDSCPLDPLNDQDADGFCASFDNCAITPNANQDDTDGDGIGDACEALACYATNLSVSALGDGEIMSTPTNCGLGGGHFDGTALNLVATPTAGLSFTGWTGTVVSSSNPLALAVARDNTIVANFCATTTDSDSDLVADACDNCPSTAPGDQTDTDGDGLGNPCDTDDDGDGLPDSVETGTGFYLSPTDTGTDPLQADTDGDGDGDGVEVAGGWDPNVSGCNPGIASLLQLQQHAIGYKLLSTNKLAACDGDGDQKIGIGDILSLQRSLLGQ